MRDLGNKLLLYLICSSFLWFMEPTPLTVAAFTVSLSATCLCTFFQDSRIVIFFMWGYCLLTLAFPIFGIYIPLFLYDACQDHRKLTLPPVFVLAAFVCFHFPLSVSLPYFLLTGTAVLLFFYSHEIDSLEQKLYQTQDDSQESALTLKERNRALIEKQDSEIYAATLSERNRIAREIHDNVGHLLTRSLLQTGALKVINKEPSLTETLSTLQETLNTAMTSIRQSVHDLHEDSTDLHTALTEVIENDGMPNIHLDYDMGTNIPREIKYTFIAIVKEAVNNMQKHSNADAAKIVVREHPGFYLLHIEDNGTNASLPSVGQADRGIGLSNMEERVHALGGSIRFSVENGFCIYITVMKRRKK